MSICWHHTVTDTDAAEGLILMQKAPRHCCRRAFLLGEGWLTGFEPATSGTTIQPPNLPARSDEPESDEQTPENED